MKMFSIQPFYMGNIGDDQGHSEAGLQQLCCDLQMLFPSVFTSSSHTCLISVFAGSKKTSFENEGEELYIVPEKGMEITGSVR